MTAATPGVARARATSAEGLAMVRSDPVGVIAMLDVRFSRSSFWSRSVAPWMSEGMNISWAKMTAISATVSAITPRLPRVIAR